MSDALHKLATCILDMQFTNHALARFGLAHHGYPAVTGLENLVPDLVPSYLEEVVSSDPWGSPYLYQTHQVLLRQHPKAHSILSDSYELGTTIPGGNGLSGGVIRFFNGTCIKAPEEALGALLGLRDYPRYPGSVNDMRAALSMFHAARPLELVKLTALRVLEDSGGPGVVLALKAFLRFNEPAPLKDHAREALLRAEGSRFLARSSPE